MATKNLKLRFGSRLRRARMLRGLSLRGLSEALEGKVSHSALQKYEKGIMGPDSSVLNVLCDVLNLRPDFFFQKREVELEGIAFRKRTKLTKKDENRAREEACEFFERYLEIEEILEIENHQFDKIDLKGIDEELLPDKMEEEAIKLRDKWSLGCNAIPNVHELLEEKGVKVKSIDCPKSLDGFSGWANNIPVIVLAKWLDGDPPRKRLTAAHELGHLQIEFPSRLDHKRVENMCFRFGGALLLPEEQFKAAFGGKRTRISLGELIMIKEDWGLSVQAIMRRACDLGLITQRHYVGFVKFARKRKWTNAGTEPGRWNGTETANRFNQLVYQAASKELITRSKAAGFLGISLRRLDKKLMPL